MTTERRYIVKVNDKIVARTKREEYAERRAEYERQAHPTASVEVVAPADARPEEDPMRKLADLAFARMERAEADGDVLAVLRYGEEYRKATAHDSARS